MSTETTVSIDEWELPEYATARRIRGKLGELNVSILALSRMTGMSRSSIERSVKTQIDKYPPDVRMVRQIADALDLNYNWVVTGEGLPYIGPDGAPTRARTWDLRIRSSVERAALSLAA